MSEIKHLCQTCVMMNEKVRGLPYVDSSDLLNNCPYAAQYAYTEKEPKLNYFRQSQDRPEAYVVECDGHKPFSSLGEDFMKAIYWRKHIEFCYIPYEEYTQGNFYFDYMHSNSWLTRRRKRIEMDGYRCKICGSATNLNVHHITYENLGCEPMDDLVTVCKQCHANLHSTDTGADDRIRKGERNQEVEAETRHPEEEKP